MKSGSLKQLLIKEYDERIDLKDPCQTNKSKCVHDFAGSESYIDPALHTNGTNDEQLNLCSRLHSKINKTKWVQWSRRTNQRDEGEDICHALVQFLSWLKHPHQRNI